MSQENVEVPLRRVVEAFNRWAADPGGQCSSPRFRHSSTPRLSSTLTRACRSRALYLGREAVIEYHERVFGQFERASV